MWIKHLWNTSHIPYSPHDDSVARTFENKNHIKIKRTCHRFIENECIWEGMSLMNAWWVSDLSSFKWSPIMAYLKEMLNGKIICRLKRRLKRFCHYKWKAWYKLLSSSWPKKNCAHFYQPPLILLSERSTKYCHWETNYCVAILRKGTNWDFVFTWRKINCHDLQIAKSHFSYLHDLVNDFWKNYYGVHVSWPCWCTHVPKVSPNKAYR